MHPLTWVQFLGASPSAHWRMLAFLPEDQLRETMRHWKGNNGDDDWAPTLALQAQVLAKTAYKGPSASANASVVKLPNATTVKLGLLISQ
eukprot:3332188-Amphidinium_carterae.1